MESAKTNYEFMLQLFIAATLLIVIFAFFLIYFLTIQRGKYNSEYLEKQKIAGEHQKQLLQEQERVLNTLSVQIHDHFGQSLNVMRSHLHRIKKLSADDVQRGIILEVASICEQMIRDTKHISFSLNTEYIMVHGLHALLEQELERLNKHFNIEGALEAGTKPAPLDPGCRLIVFRIAQEALQNIARHSGASIVAIKIEYPGKGLLMQITDDGAGFSAERISAMPGLGISNMRNRARLVGGLLDLRSLPGYGTTVELSIADVQSLRLKEQDLI